MVFHGDLPWLKVVKTSPISTRSKFRFDFPWPPGHPSGVIYKIHTSTFSTKSPFFKALAIATRIDVLPKHRGNFRAMEVGTAEVVLKKMIQEFTSRSKQKETKIICKVPTSDFDWLKLQSFIRLDFPEIRGFPFLSYILGAQNSCEVPII